jgi:hypothetical protein
MLKAIFGFLGLLIALAVVASLMKTQLGALGQLGGQSSTRVQTPSAGGADTSTGSSVGSTAGKAVGGARLDAFGATAGIGAEGPNTAQAQIQGVQQNVRDRTVKALEQGADRSNKAQP